MARSRGKKPPGYPEEYERVLRLDDGRRVRVSPILPSDAPELADAIRNADAATLHNRFLGAPPPLTEGTLKKLTEIDYVADFALVARYRGKGVAVARYMSLPRSEDGDAIAEIAAAVAPDWRRVGLASALVEMLARRALECGITEFTALFLPTNRPVIELAREGRAGVVIKEGAANLYAHLVAEADRRKRE